MQGEEGFVAAAVVAVVVHGIKEGKRWLTLYSLPNAHTQHQNTII